MKKDFVQLVKDLRLALRPAFSALGTLPGDNLDSALDDIENRQEQMLKEAGYTQAEFTEKLRVYSLDFSSENPEEWKVWHDPEETSVIIDQ